MSGPKVIRIVTREEIEAICRRHITAVEAAGAELGRRARRCGMLDDTLERALADRLEALRASFTREAWMDIQKGGPPAVAFLRSEGDRLEAAAMAAAAAARTRGRRAADAARSVAAAIAAAGGSVPTGLRDAAEGRAGSPDEAEQQVSAALALIQAMKSDPAAIMERAELARRLSAGEASRSIAEPITARTPEPTVTERRLDALLAELGILAGGAGDFARKAELIALETDASRRALLTDSLVMDAAAQVAAARARETASARLREAVASLGGLSSREAVALRDRISAAADGDPELGVPMIAEAATLVEADARATASLARRRAVLSGLASLGYEVRETMASAWERDGRIVVRKPGATDYGVELGAPADAARLQVRLVGSEQPSSPRDARRDKDQETMWCSEFDLLKAALAGAGSQLIVEKALAPGEQAVRSVTIPTSVQTDASSGRGSQIKHMSLR